MGHLAVLDALLTPLPTSELTLPQFPQEKPSRGVGDLGRSRMKASGHRVPHPPQDRPLPPPNRRSHQSPLDDRAKEHKYTSPRAKKQPSLGEHSEMPGRVDMIVDHV
ncbi:hypothetical protein EYF80_035866 [Liparis tanakae]|uniref:Uncharacterized protein n=1 Tax=Liparis tanakae TaxID=230148 RepID=A0A4Z2GKP2_9TELE|nr:hypothetical protein EYF80_035866 [Liparis tanakae]